MFQGGNEQDGVKVCKEAHCLIEEAKHKITRCPERLYKVTGYVPIGIQKRNPIWEAQDFSSEEVSGFQKSRRFLKNEERRKSTTRSSDGEGKAHVINRLLGAGNVILAEEWMLLNCGVGEDS